MARLAISALGGDAMKFSDLANRYLRYAAAKGLSPRTGESYDATFGDFLIYLKRNGLEDDIKHFTPEACEGFTQYLADPPPTDQGRLRRKNCRNSIRTKLAALSSLAQFAMRTKTDRGKYAMNENPLTRIDRPKQQKPKEKYLYKQELQALLNVEAPANERLALAFVFYTNLRVNAAATARVKNLSLDGDQVKLAVVEKGDNPDIFILPPVVAEPLLASLREREAGREETLLINASGRPYTRTSLSEMIARLARKAGITRVPVRAHLFARHSPASLAGQNGASQFEIAAMLRHRDPNTSKRYVHGVSADAARELVREALGNASGHHPGDGPARPQGDVGRRRPDGAGPDHRQGMEVSPGALAGSDGELSGLKPDTSEAHPWHAGCQRLGGGRMPALRGTRHEPELHHLRRQETDQETPETPVPTGSSRT